MRILSFPVIAALILAAPHANSDEQPYIKLCGVEDVEFPTGTLKKFKPVADKGSEDDVAIILGEDANIDEMPGLIKLRSYTFLVEVDGQILRSASDDCAATRIHEDFLITASHCVDDVEVAFSLIYGVTNTRSSRRGIARVNNILCHRGYEQINHLHNDIALVDISSPLLNDLKSNVDIVDMVNVEDHKDSELIITGWGSESPNDNPNLNQSHRLKKATMTIDWVGPSTFIGLPKTGAICSGDSGGPVYIDVNGEKKLAGVVSAQLTPTGQLQCQQANRGVFTNVYGYKNWINSSINNPISETDLTAFQAMKENFVSVASRDQKQDARLAIREFTDTHDFNGFLKQVYKEPWPDGTYVVNGDVPILDEKGLINFYLGMLAEENPDDERYAVRRIKSYDENGIGREDDDVWQDDEKVNITYCVENSFEDKYQDVKAAMQKATEAWEAAADINFEEKTFSKGECNSHNENVVFNIRPVDVDGAYWARAFFPSYYRKNRASATLNIDQIALGLPVNDQGRYNLTGLLRHELHHILGGQHEHVRPKNGLCHKRVNWRGVTDYDDYSVSNYPQCGGLGSRAMRLSELDKQGVACVYGPAKDFDFDPIKYGIDSSSCRDVQ